VKRTRLIGRFDGATHGNLVIVIGALHGNEPAGVLAMQHIFKELSDNTAFTGRLVGWIGNLRAYQKRLRFVDKDLNRQFTLQTMVAALTPPYRQRDSEDREIAELLCEIHAEILEYQPKKIFVVDVHSTSAQGGVFAIPFDTHPESGQLAQAMGMPVVSGLITGISGTTLHFFNGTTFGFPSVAAAFEAGQHDDPTSVHNAKSVIFNVLQFAGCIQENYVNEKHTPLELFGARDLNVALKYVHRIEPVDDFAMLPGFLNFQPIEAGQWLANDRNGRVLAPTTGRILMPLYQPQGREGFFIVV
jgi:succinylglutamate desuccinylase